MFVLSWRGRLGTDSAGFGLITTSPGALFRDVPGFFYALWSLKGLNLENTGIYGICTFLMGYTIPVGNVTHRKELNLRITEL